MRVARIQLNGALQVARGFFPMALRGGRCNPRYSNTVALLGSLRRAIANSVRARLVVVEADGSSSRPGQGELRPRPAEGARRFAQRPWPDRDGPEVVVDCHTE